MKIADGELRQILLHDLKLSADTVRELVADSRQTQRTLLRVALDSKLVTDKQIAQAHAKRIGVPFIDLEETSIGDKTIHRLPRQIAVRYHVISFDETPTSIKIAMADPRNEQARKAVRDYCGKTIRRYLATDRGLAHAMRAYSKQDSTPLPLSARELLMTILEQASRNGSHDIHFEPTAEALVIRRRVGKKLQTMSTLPLSKYRPLIGWCKVRIGTNVADTERPHHGRFDVMLHGVTHTVVVSTLPTIDGEKMVLRLVPASQSIPSLAKIGYGPKDTTYLEDLITHGRGLVIVAGGNHAEVPTTLASLASRAVKQANASVSTIEEPITYHIDGATQVEVTHALPFADIVSAVIAQNPSTIVTSNLGAAESSEQLIDFALSQHLVISGLYGTSLESVIAKLMSYPVAPALLAASLRLVIVQHQIEALCKYCRTSFAPAGPLKKALWEQFKFTNEARLYRKGPGCSHCQHGHHQTVLATEWLPNSKELQQLIATGADSKSIKSYVSEHSDYVAHLGKLAAKGLIGIDEASARAN